MDWFKYLQRLSLAMAAFGAFIVLVPAASAALFGVMVYGKAAFPQDFTPEAKDYIRLAHSVMGAFMLGWFITLRWVLGAAQQGIPGAWRTAVLAFSGWYLLDTGYSLLSGFWQNAALNTVIAVPFALGFARTRPALTAHLERRTTTVE